jgi:hypothetical protein
LGGSTFSLLPPILDIIDGENLNQASSQPVSSFSADPTIGTIPRRGRSQEEKCSRRQKEMMTQDSERALLDLLTLHRREEKKVLYSRTDNHLNEKEQEEALDKMRHPVKDKLSE